MSFDFQRPPFKMSGTRWAVAAPTDALPVFSDRGVSAPFAPSEEGHTASEPAARVMVVEDDFLVGLDIETRLSDAGFMVVGVAASAAEAMALARTEAPDLAVMDVRIAGLRDGVETAIELFTALGLRSVFVTAHADPHTRRRASAAKPLGWLQKPYAPEALIALVTDALAGGRC